MRAARSVLGTAGFLAASFAGPAGADGCYTYEDSMVVYYQGVALCGGSGSGRTERVDGSGGFCVTNREICHIKNRTQWLKGLAPEGATASIALSGFHPGAD